jgi:5-methylcytosine-specific restriction protein A
MPMRAPSACNFPGCGVATTDGYCPAHKTQSPRAQYDRQRDTLQPWRRWYDLVIWKSIRKVILQRDPICKACDREPSTEADHKQPFLGVWSLFVDLGNIQGLCKPCHSRKTATEDSTFAGAR